MTRNPDAERGSMSLELAILVPAVLLVLGLVVLGGRVQVAAGAVEHAAAAAARQASLARTPETARAAATLVAADTLGQQGITCAPGSTTVDTSGFAVPVGQGAQVTVHVTCTLEMSDLAIPGLPGARTLTAASTSVLDTYRVRGDTP